MKEPDMATALAKTIDRKDLTGPALRTFFNIAEAWKLSESEQMAVLGLESRSTPHNWKSGEVAATSNDALQRLSFVMGHYKCLPILRPPPPAGEVINPNQGKTLSGTSAVNARTDAKIS